MYGKKKNSEYFVFFVVDFPWNNPGEIVFIILKLFFEDQDIRTLHELMMINKRTLPIENFSTKGFDDWRLSEKGTFLSCAALT